MHVYTFHDSNEISLLPTAEAKTAEGQNAAAPPPPKKRNTKNIYNFVRMCVCAPTGRPAERPKPDRLPHASSTECQLFPFTGFSDLSEFDSSFVHLPRPEAMKPPPLSHARPLPSASSVHPSIHPWTLLIKHSYDKERKWKDRQPDW